MGRMMGLQIGLTGVVFLLVSLVARWLCDDDSGNVSDTVKVIVVGMFISGATLMAAGILVSIWS